MELGGEPPALPGHDSADQRVSLAILFIYSSLLLHTFQTLLSPVQGIFSISPADFVPMRYKLMLSYVPVPPKNHHPAHFQEGSAL